MVFPRHEVGRELGRRASTSALTCLLSASCKACHIDAEAWPVSALHGASPQGAHFLSKGSRLRCPQTPGDWISQSTGETHNPNFIGSCQGLTCTHPKETVNKEPRGLSGVISPFRAEGTLLSDLEAEVEVEACSLSQSGLFSVRLTWAWMDSARYGVHQG